MRAYVARAIVYKKTNRSSTNVRMYTLRPAKTCVCQQKDVDNLSKILHDAIKITNLIEW